jgi:hypothetical protein
MRQRISPIKVVAFAKFVNDGEFQEHFFSCKELPKTSKGQDILIFNILSSYLQTQVCLGRTV